MGYTVFQSPFAIFPWTTTNVGKVDVFNKRTSLGEVFFVTLTGYDHHDRLCGMSGFVRNALQATSEQSSVGRKTLKGKLLVRVGIERSGNTLGVCWSLASWTYCFWRLQLPEQWYLTAKLSTSGREHKIQKDIAWNNNLVVRLDYGSARACRKSGVQKQWLVIYGCENFLFRKI